MMRNLSCTGTLGCRQDGTGICHPGPARDVRHAESNRAAHLARVPAKGVAQGGQEVRIDFKDLKQTITVADRADGMRSHVMKIVEVTSRLPGRDVAIELMPLVAHAMEPEAHLCMKALRREPLHELGLAIEALPLRRIVARPALAVEANEQMRRRRPDREIYSQARLEFGQGVPLHQGAGGHTMRSLQTNHGADGI